MPEGWQPDTRDEGLHDEETNPFDEVGDGKEIEQSGAPQKAGKKAGAFEGSCDHEEIEQSGAWTAGRQQDAKADGRIEAVAMREVPVDRTRTLQPGSSNRIGWQ